MKKQQQQQDQEQQQQQQPNMTLTKIKLSAFSLPATTILRVITLLKYLNDNIIILKVKPQK